MLSFLRLYDWCCGGGGHLTPTADVKEAAVSVWPTCCVAGGEGLLWFLLVRKAIRSFLSCRSLSGIAQRTRVSAARGSRERTTEAPAGKVSRKALRDQERPSSRQFSESGICA
jgi:hypothetical protein